MSKPLADEFLYRPTEVHTLVDLIDKLPCYERYGYVCEGNSQD